MTTVNPMKKIKVPLGEVKEIKALLYNALMMDWDEADGQIIAWSTLAEIAQITNDWIKEGDI